ncbi:Uncharacterised protein [Mycobacteroides abscessus]|nr:Uncharacterised protein [Mycobacteroides abscessus]
MSESSAGRLTTATEVDAACSRCSRTKAGGACTSVARPCTVRSVRVRGNDIAPRHGAVGNAWA